MKIAALAVSLLFAACSRSGEGFPQNSTYDLTELTSWRNSAVSVHAVDCQVGHNQVQFAALTIAGVNNHRVLSASLAAFNDANGNGVFDPPHEVGTTQELTVHDGQCTMARENFDLQGGPGNTVFKVALFTDDGFNANLRIREKR